MAKQSDKESDNEKEATPERIIKELSRIAFSSVCDVVSVEDSFEPEDGPDSVLQIRSTDELSEDLRAAVCSVKMGSRGLEVRMYDKLRALYYLGQCRGLFRPGSTQDEEVTIIDDL